MRSLQGVMISQPGNIIRRLVLIIIVTSLVSACAPQKVTVKSSATTTVPTAPAARSGLGERAAAVALNQVGVPYRFGGTSPSGFDCSGLVYYSYSNVGKSLPRTTAGLWTTLQPVEDHRMRAGDLLFFNIAGKMSHVGMYLGGGRFVHAPSTGKVVSVESLGSDFYRNAFIRAGRPQ